VGPPSLRRAAANAALLLASACAALLCGELALAWLDRDAREALFRAREARGEHADRRSAPQVLADLRARGRDAVPSLVPARLLEERSGALHSALAVDGRELLPLSGPARSTTLLCNELGYWALFESDGHGFRNPDARWSSPALALLGDSFTIGRCVGTADTIAAHLDAELPTLNLGMGGTGPLAQLGVLVEYGPIARPSRVIWIVFENDLGRFDLEYEARSSILRRYLEPGFSQGLAARQPRIEPIVRSFLAAREAQLVAKSEPPPPAWVRFARSLRLPRLRERVERLRAVGREPRPRAETVALHLRALEAGRRVVAAWGGALGVAYLPRDARIARGAPPDPIAQAVLASAHALGIPALDLSDALREDGPALYAYPSGSDAGPAHLNERGYGVVAEALRPFAESLGAPSERAAVRALAR
jgi:hypothetical protein